MTMTRVMRILGVLAAAAFAGQIGLAVAADEPKKDEPKKEKKSPAAAKPGGGIQSNKAKASESPRLTKARTCSGDTPRIMKISPDEGKPGDKVTITGDNFGEAGCVSMVSFGPGSPSKFTQVDDKTITATVTDGKKGLELLTVTAATSTATKPFLRK